MAEYVNNDPMAEEESSGFDFQLIWSTLILNWYWFLLSVVLCLSGSYIYLRYKAPVYSAVIKVLIKDDKGKTNSSAMDLTDFGLISNSNGFDNELEILASKNLATRTVKNLKLYVSYQLEGRIRNVELYKSSPILVDLEESRLDQLEEPISMVLSKSGKDIKIEGKVLGKSISRKIDKLPATIHTPVGLLFFQQNPGQEFLSRDLYVTIFPPKAMGGRYASTLTAEAVNKNTSVAVLTLKDTQIERAKDYLGELANVYNLDANEDKNEVARKTEEFIKERIRGIEAELGTTEGELESYKKNSGLVNLKNDATEALIASSEYQKQQVEMQTQLTMIKSLLDYVNNPQNNLQVIPANLGLSDNNVNAQIAAYNGYVIQRNRLLKSASESSPAVLMLTSNIESMLPAIQGSLQAIYKDLELQKRSIDSQFALFTGKVSSTPTQERILTDIGRRQEIKAGLYLMLLQKREENAISLASTAAKARLIDAPESLGQVAPTRSMIWLIGLILGLALPSGILFLIQMLRYRIEGRADLEKLTKIPILADLPLASTLEEGQRAIVIRENKNDTMEECFRGLRTNLNFVMGENKKVILCTSTIPSEGKTFVATNLAMSLAFLGKKVLVVGLDVRKPRLLKLFGLTGSNQGITSYLAMNTDDKEFLFSQIFTSVMNPNLDVLPAGAIPPNPSELIAKKQLDNAFAHFRQAYDYIVVDTPPVGLVSETTMIGRVADTSLFVCRADYSPKSNLDLVNELKAENKLPNINLVLNGVDLSKKKYGYYYGYGTYGKYGKYGRYGRYGIYGKYGNE